MSLYDLLQSGPAVVTFYRGGWCPYCNIQLRAYQAVLPDITELGARLVAISPQLPDGSLSTAEANELTFDVLSDLGNDVARRFGLVWSLAEELRAALRSNNKALPDINGDDSWELPVPATYVDRPRRPRRPRCRRGRLPQTPGARRHPGHCGHCARLTRQPGAATRNPR